MLETEIGEKIKISIEFCKSCDTHNWCTHHDEQKYRQAFIDLSNTIRKQLQNVEIVGNELPTHLVPIKAKENKYYDPNCKKYVLYPAIGAFEVYVNQQLIFSKKNTNIWPNNEEIMNLIHIKIRGEPRKSIQTNSVISTEKACISEKEQKQTIKMANTILRNIDNTSLYDERSRKNTTLTDHYKKYSLKNTSNSLQSLYAETQSVKCGKISKITPEDIQKLHQIWGKKQNLPNFIKHKAFIQQNEGKKEMLVNLSSIQQESELKETGPNKRNFRKNKLSHLEMEFENLENKFLRIQNRVSEVKSRKLQFDTIDEGSGKKLKKLNLVDKINLVKNVYNPQKLIQQIKDKKKRKIEQYIHSTSQEKNEKLQQIYGAQYLKPNLASSKFKFFRNSKISRNNETKKSNQSNSSKRSQSYSQQDSQSDILINIDKQNHGSSVISLVNKNFSSSQSNFRPNPINKRTIFTRQKLSSTPKYFEGQKTMSNFEKEKRSFQSRSVLHKNSQISNKLSKNFDTSKYKLIVNQKQEYQNKKTNKYPRDSKKDEVSEKATNKIERAEKKSELIKKTKIKGNRNTISKADKQKEIYKMLDGQLKTHKKLRNKETVEKEERNYSSSEQKNQSAKNSNNLSNSIMKNNSNVKTNKLSKKKLTRQTKLKNNSRISKQSANIKKEDNQIEETLSAKSQKQSLFNTKRSEKSRGYRCSRSATEKSTNKNKSLSVSERNQTQKDSKKQKLSSSRVEKSQEKVKKSSNEVLKRKQKKRKNKRSRTEQNESKQQTFKNDSSVKDKMSQKQQKQQAIQQSDQQINKSKSSIELERQSNKNQKDRVSEEAIQPALELENTQIQEKKIEIQQNNVMTQSKPRRIYEIDEQTPEMTDIGIQKYPPKKQSQSQTLQPQFIQAQKTQKTLISVHYSDDFTKSNDQAQVRSSKDTSEKQKQNQQKEVPEKELVTTKLFHKQQIDIKRSVENAAIVKQFYGEQYNKRLIEHKKEINMVNKSDNNKIKGSYVQISKLYDGEKIKASLFGKDSIEPQKVKDNTGKLKNIIKIINIICSKNQFLIIRLFQNPQVAVAATYSVCLCENFTWKFFNIPDNIYPIDESKTVPMSHSGNQRWPVILTQALAMLFGGYDMLSKVSVTDLFHSLTGSNYINFKVKEDPEKNSRLLKFITSNEKKNFIILAQKRLHNSLGECIEEKSMNNIFYILSQKSVNNNQTLLRMKKMNSDAFWIKLQKFVSQFSQVDVLQLRVNHNFCSLPLSNTSLGHFKIIQFNFSEESFGCVTFVTENKSTDFKIYLYKEQEDNVLRLVGQVSQKNKKYSLFDCCFEQGKYFIFADIKNSQSRVCYMGQSHPQILLKQQIQQAGLKSDYTQYIPINSRPTKKTEQMPKFLNLTRKSQRGEHFGVQSAIRSDNSKKQNINKDKLRAEFIEYLTNN